MRDKNLLHEQEDSNNRDAVIYQHLPHSLIQCQYQYLPGFLENVWPGKFASTQLALDEYLLVLTFPVALQ
jgi:hypothetical protein